MCSVNRRPLPARAFLSDVEGDEVLDAIVVEGEAILFLQSGYHAVPLERRSLHAGAQTLLRH